MEKQLFDWKNWDENDVGIYIFYDCTLNIDIGRHIKGSQIPSIYMDYQNGIMQFQNDDGMATDKFKLSLTVSG